MASTHFNCPRCRRQLEKSPQAFVMGWAGLKPGPEEAGFPPTLPCPGCGYAIPTAAMLAGDLDPKRDWVTPAAVTMGVISFLYFRLGQGLSDVKAVGAGLVVTFVLLGAADLVDRVRSARLK